MNLKFFRKVKLFINAAADNFVLKSEFGGFGTGSRLEYPCHIESPNDVFVDDNVNIRYGLGIINNKGEKVEIKKYSTLAPNVTIVTNNHIPVVGVPFYLLTSSHVNDKSTSVIIEEDCWLGVGVKVLAGGRIGRGAVVGAGAVVTKAIPPYAVVVGCPAKIVGVRFSIEQIIQHEIKLYVKEDRLLRESLDILFEEEYRTLKVFGDEIPITEKEEAIFNVLKRKFGYAEPII